MRSARSPRLAVAFATGLLPALVGLQLRSAAREDSTLMTEAQTAAAAALSLEDDAFFDLSTAVTDQLKGVIAQALKGERRGPPAQGDPEPPEPVLVLGAPRQVVVEGPEEPPEGEAEVEVREELPVLVGGRTTGLRAWQVDPKQNRRLMVVDLGSGKVRTLRTALTHKRPRAPQPSGSGPRPDPFKAATWRIELQHIKDTRARYGLAWRPGRLALTALDYDLCSNTVVVSLESALPEEERAAPEPPPARFASAALTHTEPHEATPPLEGPGGAFELPARVEPGAPVPLQARVRLPASEGVLVPRRFPEPQEGEPPAPEDARLLLASVLLVGLDAGLPVQVDLAAPGVRTGAGEDATAEAAFGLDLRAAAPESLDGATFQVYLVVGAHVFGPQRLEVLPPS